MSNPQKNADIIPHYLSQKNYAAFNFDGIIFYSFYHWGTHLIQTIA